MWNGAAEVPLTKGRTRRLGHLLLPLASTWSVRLTSNYRTFALMFCSQAHPVGDPKRISFFFKCYMSFIPQFFKHLFIGFAGSLLLHSGFL